MDTNSILVQRAISMSMHSKMSERHGAVLFEKKNKIVGKGFNHSDRTSVAKFNNLIVPAIHAEFDAIMRSSIMRHRKKCCFLRKHCEIQVQKD